MTLEHIRAMYDNSDFSDFQIKGTKWGCIRAHKVILCRWQYFKTFFSTNIGPKVSHITVPNVEIARVFVRCIYGHNFDAQRLDLLISKDFKTFKTAYNIQKMWTVKGDFNWYFKQYIQNCNPDFIKEDINNLFAFNDYYEGFEVEEDVIKDNADQITKEHIEKGLFKQYHNCDWFNPIFVKYKMYDLLRKNISQINKAFIFKHFKPSLQQESCIRKGVLTTIDKTGLGPAYSYIIEVVITSFKPFRIAVYQNTGTVEGKSTKFRSIFITPTRSFSKTNRLVLDGKVYPIVSIYHQDSEVSDAYKLIEYSVVLKWNKGDSLPKKGATVYKVTDV